MFISYKDHKIFYLGAINCIGKANIVPHINPNWIDIPHKTPDSSFYDAWHFCETRITEEPTLKTNYLR